MILMTVSLFVMNSFKYNHDLRQFYSFILLDALKLEV